MVKRRQIMRGILFELTRTIKEARRTAETMGLSARDEMLLQATSSTRFLLATMPTFVPRLA
jgi:hypothetical protein